MEEFLIKSEIEGIRYVSSYDLLEASTSYCHARIRQDDKVLKFHGVGSANFKMTKNSMLTDHARFIEECFISDRRSK